MWDMNKVKNSGFTGLMYWTMSSSNSLLNFDDLYLDPIRAVPGHIHIHNNNLTCTVHAFLLQERPDPADRRSWKWRNISSVYTPETIIQPPFVIHPTYPSNALKLEGPGWRPQYVLLAGIKEKWRRKNKGKAHGQALRSSKRLAASGTEGK